MQQNILDLTAEEARQFLMKQESYCSIGLPKYYDFQPLLSCLSSISDEKNFDDIRFNHGLNKEEQNPKKEVKNISDVNYLLFQNKDGRFSWRPMQIINPVIYTYLVKKLTNEISWKLIIDRFQEFKSLDGIECYSLPLINKSSSQTDTANTILNWWNEMEQQSIKLAMKYNYLMITDITDCYGSIYTHSITWAMCGKDNAKRIIQKDKEGLPERILKRFDIGNTIDNYIEAMSFQQTDGIPQGSVLMDFIAEMVLGYADLLLNDRIKDSEISDYQILRYRDDYRIFGNTQEDVVKIAKMLTEVLSVLNFKLNVQKTIITQDLISDAIKPDKLYYIINDYKRLEEQDSHYSLQKHLLRIYKLSQEHPNSGSLQKAMELFFKRICDWKELDLFKEFGSAEILISIVTNIAYNNPKVYKSFVAIVSKILSYEIEEKKKSEIIEQILTKFSQLPNVGYLEIWLQRLTIKENRNKVYSEKICQCAAGQVSSIWNISWLKADVQKVFEDNPIVDEDEINRLPDVIEYKEVESFNRYT